MYIKDFDYRFSFIGTDDKLSELEPIVPLAADAVIINKQLSKTLAYCYLTIQCLSPDLEAGVGTEEPANESIIVDDNLITIMTQLFPFFDRFLTIEASEEEDNYHVWTITEIKADSTSCNDGLLMKPSYVAPTSVIVYNIHRLNADLIVLTPAHTTAALNFFNCVIRSKIAGSGRIIWRDPITFNTRLRNESYDYMFALYIANKYMTLIDKNYSQTGENEKLAKCIRWIDIVKELISSVVAIEIKVFDAIAFAAPIVKLHDETIPFQDVIVPIDEMKRYLCDALFFLRLSNISTKNKFTLVVTGLRSYDHLKTIRRIYKAATIEVWHTKTLPDMKGIIIRKQNITPPEIQKYKPEIHGEILFISGAEFNDVLLKKLDGRAMVKFGSTSFEAAATFVSCFAPAPVPTSATSVPAGNVIVKSFQQVDKQTSLTLFKQHANWFNNEWRDTKRWVYPSDNDVGNISYDEAFLADLRKSK
jgi:hypothetical protein